MRVGFKFDVIGWRFLSGERHGRFRMRVVPHRGWNCEQNSDGNRLATAYSLLTIMSHKSCQKLGKLGMTSRLEAYRVSAYNTAKLSENKMHDDTVAKRFGFSGGLVPGVDVMAYMMHLPVRTWRCAVLQRGLVEAPLIKAVYDGDIANVSGEESDGIL